MFAPSSSPELSPFESSESSDAGSVAANSGDTGAQDTSRKIPNSRFDLMEERIAGFLAKDQLIPAWAPGPTYDEIPTWNTSDIERISSLKIPGTGDDNMPDLLLYGLGDTNMIDGSMTQRVLDFTSGDSHIYLADASGTGKTRLLYETVSKHWSFYFTCRGTHNTSPYGSADLWLSFYKIPRTFINGQPIFSSIPLSARMTKQALFQLAHNQRIAKRVFNRLVLSRLLYFQIFLDLVERLHMPEAEARYRWFLIQLSERRIFAEPFDLALSTTSLLSDEDVAARLHTLPDELKSKVEFVIVDEIQTVYHMYSKAFTTSDHSRHAPALRELLVSIGTHLPTSRMIISGSVLDMPLAREALRSSGSRRHEIRHFHSLGGLESQQQCTDYLRHFFADLITEDDCRLAFTWLRGRYRMISAVTTLTLLYGPRNFRRVLDTAIFYKTGYRRPESELLPKDRLFRPFMQPIDQQKLERSFASGALRKAVLNFAFRGVPTSYEKDSNALVRLSAARFTTESSAIIAEPLVLLALAQWLASSTEGSIHRIMRRKISNMALPLRDNAFVEGLAPCLWDAFALKTSLDVLLRFPDGTPLFAKRSASLVLPRLSRRHARFTKISEHPKNLLRVAEDADDVFAWLRNASEPFLIPDPQCAAGLLFVLKLDKLDVSQYVLVMVQVKASPLSSKSRPERDHRVVPFDVNETYKSAPEAQKTFTNLLSQFPALSIGTRKRARGADKPLTRFARFPVLRLLCFNEPWRINETYDPPVASINFAQLLSQPRPQEFSLSDVLKRIDHRGDE